MADINNQAPKVKIQATQEEVQELTHLTTSQLKRDILYEQDQIASYATHLKNELDETLNNEHGSDIDADDEFLENMNEALWKHSRGEKEEKLSDNLKRILEVLGKEGKFEENARRLTGAAIQTMYENPNVAKVATMSFKYDPKDSRSCDENTNPTTASITNFDFLEWLNFYKKVRESCLGPRRNESFSTLLSKYQVVGQLNQLAQIPVQTKNEDEGAYKQRLAKNILAFRDKAINSRQTLMKFRNPVWTPTQFTVGLGKILFGGFIYYPLKYLARAIARKSGLVTHTGNEFFHRVTNRIDKAQKAAPAAAAAAAAAPAAAAAAAAAAGKKSNGQESDDRTSLLKEKQPRGQANEKAAPSRWRATKR